MAPIFGGESSDSALIWVAGGKKRGYDPFFPMQADGAETEPVIDLIRSDYKS